MLKCQKNIQAIQTIQAISDMVCPNLAGNGRKAKPCLNEVEYDLKQDARMG
jgi:hypothetical protein